MARILMIYNADSGAVAAVLDTLHKLVSPSTYACGLCTVTYGLFGMRKAWARTVAALPHPVEFLHRDEWQARSARADVPLPAILLEAEKGFRTIVSAEEFATIPSLDALQALIMERFRLS